MIFTCTKCHRYVHIFGNVTLWHASIVTGDIYCIGFIILLNIFMPPPPLGCQRQLCFFVILPSVSSLGCWSTASHAVVPTLIFWYSAPITETHHRHLSSARFFAVSYLSHMLLISCSLFLPLVRFPVVLPSRTSRNNTSYESMPKPSAFLLIYRADDTAIFIDSIQNFKVADFCCPSDLHLSPYPHFNPNEETLFCIHMLCRLKYWRMLLIYIIQLPVSGLWVHDVQALM